MNIPSKSSYKRDDPSDWKTKSTADYIREFSRINGLKPCDFTINGAKVTA